MMEAVSSANNDAVGGAASGSIVSISSAGSHSDDDPSSWLATGNDPTLDALSTVNVRVQVCLRVVSLQRQRCYVNF